MSEQLQQADVINALSRVDDPEIGRPITELGMVKSVTITGNDVQVVINLTIAGCPLKSTLVSNSEAVLQEIPGIGNITVTTDVMSDEQRRELKGKLRGQGAPEGVNPFTQPGNTTQVFAVASGKGGVGKSSMTVNLGVALAQQGLKVGILDADIYGHSVPQLLGSHQDVNQVDDMIMPPIAHGVKLISIGHFVEGNSPIVWRGPMLHRAINQFLTDVFWGDLDVLLLDLPPGTGDVAITVAQLLPHAELLIVTTPQAAAAEVAERAGSLSLQTHQQVRGVIENMAAMVLDDGQVIDVFGAGGGAVVAERLSTLTGQTISLLGEVPLDPQLRVGGDNGTPIVVAAPDSPAAKAITAIAKQLMHRGNSLKGQPLGLSVTNS
ncbi:P-loop NTPase [Corynebacterium choanae]|uniref:Iron-sulfur cluster carrier protein n=1 Tax=Corynebacterium choanae TaxID=1862358 RepID=A0A3G6J5Q1_9CORY|nr:P-loop NTPase [Corynebacterium choanae]AZA13266.1 Flagellum site-determining protein YlxH [Corynebacterium choanae]